MALGVIHSDEPGGQRHSNDDRRDDGGQHGVRHLATSLPVPLPASPQLSRPGRCAGRLDIRHGSAACCSWTQPGLQDGRARKTLLLPVATTRIWPSGRRHRRVACESAASGPCPAGLPGGLARQGDARKGMKLSENRAAHARTVKGLAARETGPRCDVPLSLSSDRPGRPVPASASLSDLASAQVEAPKPGSARMQVSGRFRTLTTR
jgi:hypothetical protein